MTSHRHPAGDKAVSEPASQVELKTEIHRLLQEASMNRQTRLHWTQRLMKHHYSDLELRWIVDHLRQLPKKI